MTLDSYLECIKNCYVLIGKKQATQLKIEQELLRHSTEEGTKTANKHTKRCSTTLEITETQIKVIMRYHCIPVWLKLKTLTMPSVSWELRATGNLLYCWENKNLAQPLWKAVSHCNRHIHIPYSSNFTPGHILHKQMRDYVHQKICIRISINHYSKNCNKLQCPSIGE